MRDCTNCKHTGQTGIRCYNCKRGRGNLDVDLWEAACPLPRIGSKDWGWRKNWDFNGSRYSCDLCEYELVESGYYCVFRRNGKSHDLFGSDLSLRDAKTLAESRARRDWRRENGDKK